MRKSWNLLSPFPIVWPLNLMWKPFNTNILNSILYTNKKSLKIGYCEHDRCSFCDKESETFHHLFFFCLYSNILWKHFENSYFTIAKRVMALTTSITLQWNCHVIDLIKKGPISAYISWSLWSEQILLSYHHNLALYWHQIF